MLIDANNNIWDLYEFEREDDLEQIVMKNYTIFFGDQSLFFKKTLIRTLGGDGTVPDGYVVDLESRSWYLVEVELAHHGVFSHIVPQVSKQLQAAETIQGKSLLRQAFLTEIKSNSQYRALFKDAEIEEIDIEGTLQSILRSPPKVAIPIDIIKPELETWAQSLRYEVKLIPVRRYRNRETKKTILDLPDDLSPVVTTRNEISREAYSLFGAELLRELIREKLLKNGEQLSMAHKNSNFVATVTSEGSLLIDGEHYSPSYGAIYCIKKVTPSRNTVNGLLLWKNSKGESLFELRERLAQFKRDEAA